MSSSNKHAVFIGASRGIGKFTLLYLLQGSTAWTATALLRSKSTLSDDKDLKPFVDQGRLTLVQGDATNQEDVNKLLQNGRVDLVVSSIGSVPVFSWTGIRVKVPDLCTTGATVLVKALASVPKDRQPRVIAVSSMGMNENHKFMPLAWRIMYPMLLHTPHLDKEAMEYLLCRASTAVPTPTAYLPSPTLLSKEAIDAAPENFLKELIIVRPAFLPGGDEPPLGREKTKVGEEIRTYTCRRSEVGRFIAEDCVEGGEWLNKKPVVGY